MLEGVTFNLLTVVLGVTGIFIALVSTLYARLALRPGKRLLTVSAVATSSLIEDRQELGEIGVTYRGKKIERPYTIAIEIASQGRYSIGSEQFDRGRPVTIGLDAQVIGILSVSVLRPEHPTPELIAKENGISMPPDVIASGQSITVNVLTNGRPQLSVVHHLVDTKVVARAENEPAAGMAETMASLIASGGLGGLALAILAAVVALLTR